jgi:O-antigen biosynthesis protein
MGRRACGFEPVRIVEVELSDALPLVPPQLPGGNRHRRAQSLVRLHSRPLGVIELVIGEQGVSPSEYGERVWHVLGSAINEHLIEDGLTPVGHVPPAGLPYASPPACVEERRRAAANAPFASVVVPTRDRTDSLTACLRSLLELDYPGYEIIVVDNRPSTTETANLLKRQFGDRSTPDVRYVREDGPVAVARNRGVNEARGTVIAFTDDDVIVDRSWLLELVRGFENSCVACVTGMILPAELETPSQVWLEQYGGFSKGFRKRLFDLYENRPETPLFPYASAMLGSGANMSFRTDILRHLGGFDPATGPGTCARGGEDLAAFFEVIAAGYSVAYQPTALVYHRHRKDYESLREQAFSYGVGLSAYLTKTLVDRPTRLPEFGLWLPHAFTYLLSPTSAKNANKRADYPRELTWLERKGMLYGPVAYLRARRQSRHFGRTRSEPHAPMSASANEFRDAPR